jgi:putative DNA primase/helicase
MSAADIAKVLHGHRSGDGWLCRCPLPTHGRGGGDKHPSLLVKDGDTAILCTCFAGCDRRDVLAELRHRGMIETPSDRRDTPRRPREPLRLVEPEPEPDATALALWQAAEPIGDEDVAGRYLRGRALCGPWPPTLRFARSVAYPRAAFPFPAMVAAIARPDRHIIACQVTFLRGSDASKAPVSAPRLTVGRLGTGAVRLAAAGEVLGLAEGIETALSATQLSGVPCWASLGGHRLAKVTLPDGVREVHIFADADEAGRLAAEQAAERFIRQRRRVVIRRPPDDCKDFNDAVRAEMRAVA